MGDTSQIYISESDFRNRYQYSQKDLLGEGGFAQVYKAYDKQFKEYVALKFYNKGEEGKYDVLHEMKDSRKFSHKNIIRIHDAFIVKFENTFGHSFVQVGILEYADGGNLRDFIGTTPSESKFLDVLTGILSALEYLHKDKKIIHRDLSPENILMFVEGDNWIPKIADFGISKKVDVISDVKDQQKSALLLGKVSYMAPEQFYPEKFGIHGTINTNVDLWSFGVILYELFTHKKPFGDELQDNPLKTIQSITSDTIPNLNEIPDPYRSVVRKCLEKNANARVKSAAELVSILNKSPFIKEHKPAETVALTDFKQKGIKKIYIYSGLAAILILFIAGYFIFMYEPSPKPPGNDKITENGSINIPKIQAGILSLIEQGRFYLALDSINRLPDEIKVQQIFIGLHKQAKDSIKVFRVDSLLDLGNRYFNTGNKSLFKKDNMQATFNFNQALKKYNVIVTDYDPENRLAQIKKNRTQRIVDSLRSIPPPNPIIQYKVTIEKQPEFNRIHLTKITSTEKNTIISLELLPTSSPFAIYGPGHEDAFYIQYIPGNRELPLKGVEGIKPGKYKEIVKNVIIKLSFDKLPENVVEFNLKQGKVRMDESIQYYDFLGIRLIK